ncbi:MAG TPA: hypothetical protein VFP54_09245 [Acidimicrobiales bacterium]|nr:hypothetical protein [Acidimicrobiales bacterium]
MKVQDVIQEANHGCGDCAHDLGHCHGMLVLHLDGEAGCTEPGCDGDPAVHAWMASCWDVLADCQCGTPVAPRVAQAA